MRATDAALLLHGATRRRIELPEEPNALGVIARLEGALDRIETELAEQKDRRVAAERRLADFQPRIGDTFEFQAELDAKRADYAQLEADLAQQKADGGEEQRDPIAIFEEEFGVVIRFPGRGRADVLDDGEEANDNAVDAEAG